MIKNSEGTTKLQIETCVRFIGAACIAKGTVGGEDIVNSTDPMRTFGTYNQIGEPIIGKLLDDASKKGRLLEVCSTGEGLRDFILETAREVIKLLEHA